MLKTRTKVCSTFIGCVPLLGGLCSSPTSWEVASVIVLVVARHMARLMVNCFRFANQVAQFMCNNILLTNHMANIRCQDVGSQVEHNWNTSGTQVETWNTSGTQLEHKRNTTGTQLENWNTTVPKYPKSLEPGPQYPKWSPGTPKR